MRLCANHNGNITLGRLPILQPSTVVLHSNCKNARMSTEVNTAVHRELLVSNLMALHVHLYCARAVHQDAHRINTMVCTSADHQTNRHGMLH